MEQYFAVGFAGAAVALLFAALQRRKVLSYSEGNETMQKIAASIREGANAYLKHQYETGVKVFAIVFVLLFFMAFISDGRILSKFTPFAFVTGGVWSMLAGFIGMRIATNSNARTAQAASESLNRGLRVAFSSGSVMGFTVVGLGLLDITLWFFLLRYVFGVADASALGNIMVMNGMGASFMALFARVGGGIYTKAADVGADLVGKGEAGIPEDDPRNPATIADNVGDNVGDVAGMGADLYESYCGSILSTAALGAAIPTALKTTVTYVNAPMIVAGIGVVLSLIGIFAVRCKEGASMGTLLRALRLGTWGSSVLILVACGVLAGCGILTWGVFGAIVSGLLAGVVIGYSTEYYTSDEYGPTKELAAQAQMGPATAIIDGLSLGMLSAAIPVVATVIAIICAFASAGGFTKGTIFGLYGIGFAAVGMLATLGITLATDAYGPIADNAGGNAEMSALPPHVRERTDALDMLGNTTAATGKGFAIGSAALTAMALLAAEIQEIEIWGRKFDAFPAAVQAKLAGSADHFAILVDFFKINVMNPLFLCGCFLGAMMAFVFCALTMKAVGRAAGRMVEEVRRQFRTIPGIMDGTGKPDYARCVAISTRGAQHEMMLPALLAIIIPVATGLILGVPGIMGLLIGGLTCGFSLACMLNNAGGAWDNAKKHIEKGNFGGKKLPDGTKNPVHGAAVIGDTVGDPCKDTSGPALNILVKLMSMVAVVFTPLFIKVAPAIQEWLGLIQK